MHQAMLMKHVKRELVPLPDAPPIPQIRRQLEGGNITTKELAEVTVELSKAMHPARSSDFSVRDKEAIGRALNLIQQAADMGKYADVRQVHYCVMLQQCGSEKQTVREREMYTARYGKQHSGRQITKPVYLTHPPRFAQ